jgi:phosphohistidine phosphatase
MRDRDRPLDSRGYKDAPKIGAYLAHHRLTPDHALVSPARRTRETWSFAAQAFKSPPLETFEDRIYDASPETLLNIIREQGTAGKNLLLVGHNPSMHSVAVTLIAAGDLDAREQLRESLPTSGLVIIEFPFDSWAKLHPQSGRVTHFVTPRSLKAATD